MEGVRVLEVAQFTFVPGGGGDPRRLGRRRHQGGAPGARRHPARLHQHGRVPARPGPASADRASQSRQAQRRHRRVHARWTGSALRDRQDRRRVPDQLHARTASEEQVRRRAHPRGEPEHHLRARQRLRRQGPRTRHRRLRRHRVLDAQRRGPCVDPRGAGWRAVARHPGVRRLDRRDEHRGRNLGGAVSSRAHRRGGGDRRVAAEHGLVGGGASVTQGMETGETMRSPMPDSDGSDA